MKLETKVGAFFCGTIAILGLLVLRMDKLSFGNSKNQRILTTQFDDVVGLSLQSAVRIAGVKVGQVQDIKLEKGKAIVTLSIQGDLPVYSDAVASLTALGILGEKYIELNQGNPLKGELPSGQKVGAKASVSLDTVMERVSAISEDLKGITFALNKSIGGEEGRVKLDEIVDNIRTLTGEFRAMAQENRGSIHGAMANTEAITADLRKTLPELSKQFADLGAQLNALVAEARPEMKGVMGDVRTLAQGFQGTSKNLEEISTKINKGDGTLGQLLNDPSLMKKVNTAVDNLNEMLSGVKNMELRLDMHAAQWDKRGDSRMGVSLELAPRKDYWYGIELGSTPDGKLSESIRTVVVLDPVTGKPKETQEKVRTYTTDMSFNATAMFYKRFGPAVVSAGIVEGKGGAGLEFRALDDRFRLGALTYDWNKRDDKPKPRLRINSTYQLYKGLYLEGGLQDALNKDLRTLFFGGGIRWTDDDLKKLLGLAGAAK